MKAASVRVRTRRSTIGWSVRRSAAAIAVSGSASSKKYATTLSTGTVQPSQPVQPWINMPAIQMPCETRAECAMARAVTSIPPPECPTTNVPPAPRVGKGLLQIGLRGAFKQDRMVPVVRPIHSQSVPAEGRQFRDQHLPLPSPPEPPGGRADSAKNSSEPWVGW